MSEHKIITCASYGNTGSGVITDYLLEFDNILNSGDFEFRFLQDYDGVSTLEHALVHNKHRMNSDMAIKNFIRYIKFQSGDFTSKRYEKFFHNRFKEISFDYLNKLVDLKWDGYWEQYQIVTPKIITILKYRIFPRLIRLFDNRKYSLGKYVPTSSMYLSMPTEIEFLKYTNQYIIDLCNGLDIENKFENIYFDQLVPPLNIQTYLRYYPNMKVVVVDRDPRDHYIDNIIKWREGWIPTDVNDYVKYYRKLREGLKTEKDDSRILRICFEDSIYKYDEFLLKVNSFLALNTKNHINPKKFFNPQLSVNNTQLWKKHKVNMSDIHQIERELSEFCYNFE